MSITTVNYFHRASLEARFMSELDQALLQGRMSADEQAWLRSVSQPSPTDATDPVRVDHLMLRDGSVTHFELSAALMFSHEQDEKPQVYLFTLAWGLEAFADRHALLDALRTRFTPNEPDAVFHYVKIDNNCFHAQMLATVEQQAGQVAQLGAVLKSMPSLRDAANRALVRALREVLPHIVLDPAVDLLQIVPSASSGNEALPTVQTLVQAVLDDFSNVAQPDGQQRRFLDAQARPLNAVDAALFPQALSRAVGATAERYSELLSEYWGSGESGNAGSHREEAIRGFTHSWRREFYSHFGEGDLTPELLNELLPLLQSTSGQLPGHASVRCSRITLKIGDHPFCSLAGTFVAEPGHGVQRPLLWFSPGHRLMSFADVRAFAAYLVTAQGREELRPALALQDQPLLLESGRVRLALEVISTPVFADRVDSVLALQASNLRYVMGLPRRSEAATAMIDDALDVRSLLDPRQSAFTAGRWRTGPQPGFHDVWPVSRASETILPVPAAREAGLVADDKTALPLSWMEHVRTFESRAERLRMLEVVLVGHAEERLQHYLCVLINGPIKAANVCLQWQEPVAAVEPDTQASEQLVSMDLVSYLLECVSEHRVRTLPARTSALLDVPQATGFIHVDLIDYVLEQAIKDFSDSYWQRFERSRTEPQRQGNRHLQVLPERIEICQAVMRIDLALALLQKRIDTTGAALARQVMNRPRRAMRVALGAAAVEASAVSLFYEVPPVQAGAEPAVHLAVLCDTWVLTQPQTAGSPVLLWSSEFGWRQFDSLQHLTGVLHRNLRGGNRERWLRLMSERDRRQMRARLSHAVDQRLQIRLDRLEGHVVHGGQERLLQRQKEDLQELCLRATRGRIDAELFTRMATDTELDGQLTIMIDGLAIRIENSRFVAMLPPWLGRASIDDLKLYYNIFKRYYDANPDNRDFLFGAGSLQDYARQQLTARLSLDFPDHALDPDQIVVTSRRYVSAFPAAGELPSMVPAATITHQESLCAYAINRFVEEPESTLAVSEGAQLPTSTLLTPEYIQRVVSDLDIGASYIDVLQQQFAPAHPRYAERKSLFSLQLPIALIAQALADKVVGDLSVQAYEFIVRVFDMPDGIAREPLNGTQVMISPLQLVASAGMTPDVAAGVYLIGPTEPDSGPVVLYATYHSAFTFREYASREALMAAIRSDEALQNLLLERVDPLVHRRYAHGGFDEPHLPFSVEDINALPPRAPGPVTLSIAPIEGNALDVLFVDAITLLLALSKAASVTNAQSRQAARAFLATLALSQALTLLPSKVAALVTLWQSHTLLRASVESLSGKRWGQALSEFTAALGVVVTAREQAIEESALVDLTDGGSPQEVGDEAWPMVFSWQGNTLTAEQRLRLEGLEVHDVALSELQHDELLNLYLDKLDRTPYAVVAGKVYRLRSLSGEGGWAIVGADGSPGPRLVLDENQHWQLDLNLRLRGGGGVVTRFKSAAALESAEGEIVILASGMTEIRQRYRDRARRIGQAHQKAKQYLENCLDNLNVHQRNVPLDARVSRILGDFFGVEAPDAAMLDNTERTIRSMFEAVMDPSLSPFSSPRFVLGMSRPGRQDVAAFVLPADPQRRLFLTQQFFRTFTFRLKPEARVEGFDAVAHSQAATLLHELSHLTLNTKDIAYLETTAPYPDLLMGNNAANVRVKADVQRLQLYRMSHRTPKNDLFTQQEGGTWRDVTREDALGFSTILRLTQTATLDAARTVFLSDAQKRSQVLFANADSVTLLILQLGRHNYTALAP